MERKTPPLGDDEILVVDLSDGIRGNYATKLLADAGAQVVKVEPPAGDPLRRRRLFGDDAPSSSAPDSLLFRFLACSKASVVVDPTIEADLDLLRALLLAADVVVWQPGTPIAERAELQPAALREMAPQAIVCSITPFGLVGEPSRPTNEFTLQAMAGGSSLRGVADRAPLAVGAQAGDWAIGVFAAAGILTGLHRRRETGQGELVDVACLDALHLTQTMFAPTFAAAAGRPMRAARVRTIPMIHPTVDGYVGFQLTTGQQWQDFCSMIGQDEWREDPTLTRFDVRMARFDEVNDTVDAWTMQQSTDDIVELAALLRIPCAPVGNGQTIPQYDHVVARGWMLDHPGGGFRQPEVPYTFHGSARRRDPRPAPALGSDTERLRRRPPAPIPLAPTGRTKPLPFEGLRILDFTAFWAGPIISHFFAMMGADVIHVESTKRVDGLRAATLRHDMSDGWWEACPFFVSTNTNKRGLTLDMDSERGRELARRLIPHCDIVVENYSPRVMGHWNFGYDELRAIKPDIIMLRAPGFGLSGPWAERVAYAPTVEQACGAAWVTGFDDDRPDVSSGAMDPLAGTHAAFAALLALEHRRRTGDGLLVEVPQFTSGFNLFAELVVQHSGTGRILGRVGNRSWSIAPQGNYRCADAERDMAGVPPDDWVAISVEDEAQWQALARVIGAEALCRDRDLATAEGRNARHDEIDAAIQSWSRTLSATDAAARLTEAGIPAAAVAEAHHLDTLPEVKARELYETVEHTVLPPLPIVGYPSRLEHGPTRMHRRRAPTLGEHNRDILGALLQLDEQEMDDLEAAGVIGTSARTATAW